MNPNIKKAGLTGLILVTIFLSISLYSRLDTSTSDLLDKPLVVGRYTDALTLDPSIATDSESFQVTVNIFETLVRLDGDGKTILPGLAETWRSSEDGLTWLFKIRKGVTFHDGAPLTAESIAFNFQRWMNEDNLYHTGQFSYWNHSFGGFPGIVKSVVALSDYTLEITLNEPYAPFLSVLSLPPFGIASPETIKTYNDTLWAHPVGTGPFVFDSWSMGKRIHLTRNTAYWNAPAKVSSIDFIVIDDNSDEMNLLETGAVHIIEGVHWDNKTTVEAMDKVLLRYKPLSNIAYLGLNHEVEPFGSLEVRRAIDLLIDKERIISEALTPLSKAASTFLPPQSNGYHEGIDSTTVNVSEAKRLLKNVGYPDGFETELWVSATSRDYLTNPVNTAYAVKKQLAKANIDVTVKVFPWAEFLEKIKTGEHPMVLTGWNGDTTDPDNFLFTLFHSENAKQEIALNYFFYRDDEMDKLLLQARHTLNDDFRNALYRDIQERIKADVVGIPLAHTMSLTAVYYEVLNYKPNAIGHHWLYDIDLRSDDEQ